MKKEINKQQGAQVKDAGLETAAVEVGVVAPEVTAVESNNGFVKYDEVVNETKLNMFKSITLKASNRFLTLKESAPSFSLKLKYLKMISLRYNLERLKDKIIGVAGMEEVDGTPRFCGNLIESVKITKNKQILIVLKKAEIVEERHESILDTMRNDPLFRIREDLIPNSIKMLAETPVRVQSYGDDLVVVLDQYKIMKYVILKEDMENTDKEDMTKFIKVGTPVIDDEYFNFSFVVENAQLSNMGISLTTDNFVCARLQMSHEELSMLSRNYLVAYDSTIPVDPLVFVRTADLASQPNGAEAIKPQLVGVPDIKSMPLIRVDRNTYRRRANESRPNGLLNLLIDNSYQMDRVDDRQVLKVLGPVLETNKVYSYNIGLAGELAILPSYKKIVMASILGKIIPSIKMDIADNGRALAINMSI